MTNGKFVISLDFELLWGVRDSKGLQGYGENILNARKAIPRILVLFEEYNIHATFATVGFLFFDKQEELLASLPLQKPSYHNPVLSPYIHIDTETGKTEEKDPYHYAKSLIRQIKKAGHEIGSHTFSHYYCLEPGQTADEFDQDISQAVAVARRENIVLKSLVFPRNQYNNLYLNILKNHGFVTFRGNENSFFFDPSLSGARLILGRGLRLIDSYINLSGHNIYAENILAQNGLVNIPASRFLRPYIPQLKLLEGLRLVRIKNSMTAAAQKKKVFHLWWHPHNFGKNEDENFRFLEKILSHFKNLKEKYNFQCITMGELGEQLIRQ